MGIFFLLFINHSLTIYKEVDLFYFANLSNQKEKEKGDLFL